MYKSGASVLCRILIMQPERKSISLRALNYLAALRKEYPGGFIIIIFDAVEVSYNFCKISEINKRKRR